MKPFPDLTGLFVKDDLIFPERDESVHAHWRALYMEPMIGSSERLCFGAVVYSENDFHIAAVRGLERLHCLYDGNADILIWSAGQAIKDLTHLLESGGMQLIEQWMPPIEGIELGEPTRTAGASLEEIANNALMMSASIVEKKNKNTDIEESIGSRKFGLLVRDLVAQRHPSLSNYFGIERMIKADARAIRFGFSGHHLAANFAGINPSNISISVQEVKSKMLDLINLKQKFGDTDTFFEKSWKSYMLGIMAPNPMFLSDKTQDKINRAMSEINLESAANNISFELDQNPEVIAKKVIEMEMPEAA